MGAHLTTIWLWFFIRLLETLDAHSGYRFPFSPFAWFPNLINGADRHDYHHSHVVGNFGSFFTGLKVLFG
jgi:sterol desaturase/sphingolipid hydroxylase (fatty acid hydroxylase superfamily)